MTYKEMIDKTIKLLDLPALQNDTGMARPKREVVKQHIIEAIRQFKRDTGIDFNEIIMSSSVFQNGFFTIPANILNVRRILYDGEELKVVSANYLDKVYPNWKTRTGTPMFAVAYTSPQVYGIDPTIDLYPDKPDMPVRILRLVPKPMPAPTSTQYTMTEANPIPYVPSELTDDEKTGLIQTMFYYEQGVALEDGDPRITELLDLLYNDNVGNVVIEAITDADLSIPDATVPYPDECCDAIMYKAASEYLYDSTMGYEDSPTGYQGTRYLKKYQSIVKDHRSDVITTSGHIQPNDYFGWIRG